MSLQAPNNVLVIGVGGTGKYILTHLKRALIQANNHWLTKNTPLQSLDPEYGQALPEGVHLLCLDLDNRITEGDIAIDYNQNLGTEFINFSTDLTAIKQEAEQGRDQDRWPWFEAEDAKKLTLPIGGEEGQGAGQQRQFSRLCLLENLRPNARLHQIIEQHLTTFRNRRQAAPSIANYFIIVGSIAGGTGSGTLIDLAQILKHKIETGRLSNSTVAGIAVLSEIFTDTFKDKQNQWKLVQANCMAAMREIRRFLVLKNSGYPFAEYDHNWNPTPRVTDRQAPLDVCYVVDGTRSRVQHLTNYPPQKTLFPAIADYLTNLCLQDRPFDPANTRNIIGNTVDGVFSALGCHSWIFPADDIIKDFSIQLTQSFIGDLRRPAPITFDWDGATNSFLNNSLDFYSQNGPPEEYYPGVTKQSEKFGLMSQLAQLIEDKKKNNAAPALDVNFFSENIFAPANFPLRFNDPTINDNLVAGYELPTLNLSQAGTNDSDHYEGNPDIAGTNDPQQVVQLTTELMLKNIGTQNDPLYNKNKRGTRRTYHGILEYYRKIAKEIFGGYQDDKGRYYPGLVENKLFLLLNRVRHYQPVINPTTQKPETLPVTGNEKKEVTYETNQSPVDSARCFCLTLISKLEEVKYIIDQAYDTQFSFAEKKQIVIDQEEATRREYEYLNANRVMIIFKKKPYLESMQRWLLSQRLEVMKRTLTGIIQDCIEILNGWLETLGNFDNALSSLEGDLLRIYHEFSLIRSENEAIKTRTYLTAHRSDYERKLYRYLIETPKEQTVRDGELFSPTNKDKLNAKSFIHIGPNPADVNTRPGMIRTGRILTVHFCHGKTEEALAVPEIGMKHARFFCQGVRDVNFWTVLTQYQDANGRRRYDLDAQQLPSLLTGDVVDYSVPFIHFQEGRRVRQIDGTNDRELVIYVDGAPAAQAGINFRQLQETFRAQGFSNIHGANTPAGQGHQLTAVQQVYSLPIDALHSFENNLDIYRQWLIHTYTTHSMQATGTPLHLFLGEKHASWYEQFIMDHWRELGLEGTVDSSFFLPLAVVLALENLKAVRSFLWAGLHMKRLYWVYDSKIGNHYAIQVKKDRRLPLHSTRGDLLGAMHVFTLPASNFKGRAMLDDLKREIEANYDDFLEQRNTDREACRTALRGYIQDPINQLVLEPGTTPPTTKRIVADPGRETKDMNDEQRLNLLFKAILLEEMLE
ncbi:MAG: tubulin-like doman-containing protein [Deltaproteobacteria bacterium]|nr:tubulin-like doman-containing protein [Deltaproteobacteria bacterium]